jgi:hypothetical protein
MIKFELSYPQGNGGHWLGHLISCLILDIPFKEESLNYHESTIAKNVVLNHNLINDNILPRICFSGTYYFNMYCNYVKKTNFSLAYINEIENDRYENRVSQAAHLLEFQHQPISLSSDSIYLNNSEIFIQDLYNTLDNLQLDYSKDITRCTSAIAHFNNSIADAHIYFNNWDDKYWINWCLGISKKELKRHPLNGTLDQLADFLYPNKDFYIDYTLKRMI